MNWLKRAQREIPNCSERSTAITAERGQVEELKPSNVSNGSISSALIVDLEESQEEFEDRAAIMEYEGGLTREKAERAAWTITADPHRMH